MSAEQLNLVAGPKASRRPLCTSCGQHIGWYAAEMKCGACRNPHPLTRPCRTILEKAGSRADAKESARKETIMCVDDQRGTGKRCTNGLSVRTEPCAARIRRSRFWGKIWHALAVLSRSFAWTMGFVLLLWFMQWVVRP